MSSSLEKVIVLPHYSHYFREGTKQISDSTRRNQETESKEPMCRLRERNSHTIPSSGKEGTWEGNERKKEKEEGRKKKNIVYKR